MHVIFAVFVAQKSLGQRHNLTSYSSVARQTHPQNTFPLQHRRHLIIDKEIGLNVQDRYYQGMYASCPLMVIYDFVSESITNLSWHEVSFSKE